jgi:ribonuclease HII
MIANADEENKLIANGYNLVAGCDESGIGSFAGDVYAAVVIFPPGIDYKALMPGLNDSKQKSEIQRNILYTQIKSCAIDYAVASASVEEIDTLNVYWARFVAVNRALDMLYVKPDYIIMDGNKDIPNTKIPQHAIVKGDAKSISIAAASILAKVERDKHIDALAKLVHPDYGWIKNKSYYSADHIAAIKKHGKTKYHRHKYVSKYIEEIYDGW